MGRELNIPVSEFYYTDFYGDKTFVTKNFINKTLQLTSNIFIISALMKGLINAISKETGNPLDTRIFINTLVFDAFIGNHDRHGRNLAFMVTSSCIKLSPIYDNVSY